MDELLRIKRVTPEEMMLSFGLHNAHGQVLRTIQASTLLAGEFIWTLATDDRPPELYVLKAASAGRVRYIRVLVE